MDCIFCKIIKGEIPSAKIYENDKVYAFLDIAPVNPGHTLVIPKEHYERIEEASEEALCEAIKAVKKLAPKIIKAVSADSFNLIQSNGKKAGQVIDHIHFHIIPRFADDGYPSWTPKKYEEGKIDEIAGKIKKELE